MLLHKRRTHDKCKIENCSLPKLWFPNLCIFFAKHRALFLFHAIECFFVCFVGFASAPIVSLRATKSEILSRFWCTFDYNWLPASVQNVNIAQ